MIEIPQEVIRWIRGELDDSQFERWVYANHDLLVRALGPERASELFELDFRPGHLDGLAARRELQQRLIGGLPRPCRCVLMVDRQVVPLGPGTRATDGSPFLARFERIRGGPNGSELWRCNSCAQAWFVILDREDDAWYFERLSVAQAAAALRQNRWPETFAHVGATLASGHLRWSQSEVARTFRSAFGVDVLFPEAASGDR